MDKSNLLIACVMLAGLAVPGIVYAQGEPATPTPATAFTYQGYLAESGLPATGIYDLQFAIHESASGGDALAVPVEFGDVQVSDGLFAVTLDFGAVVFDGSQRWLEISVRPGAQTSAFAPLVPRQPINVAPQSIWSATAGSLDGVTSAGFWRAGGNTGTSPDAEFLGTTDAAPLAFRVNNIQVLRLEADETGSRTIFGASNGIDPASPNASILGGKTNTIGAAAPESGIVSGLSNSIGANQRSSFIGGGARNQILDDNHHAVIVGGRDNRIGANNSISLVVGGAENRIGDSVDGGLIVGGFRNDILGSIVPGTVNPFLLQVAPLILGGSDNEIGRYAEKYDVDLDNPAGWGVILGGDDNRIGINSGFAVIAGGRNNIVADNCPYTFAAGRRARVNHRGAFVWSDGQNASFASAGANTFNIRAAGGVHLNADTSQYFGSTTRQMLNLWDTIYGIGVQSSTLYFRTVSNGSFSWHRGGIHSNTANSPGSGGVEMMRLNSGGLRVNGTFVSASDRGIKENFAPVDSLAVLEKVAALPLSEWNYREDAGTRHIGPMAQDFHAAFGVGPDDRHIATVDADGVALAAIQGLNRKLSDELQRKEAELAELRGRVERLEQLLAAPTLTQGPVAEGHVH